LQSPANKRLIAFASGVAANTIVESYGANQQDAAKAAEKVVLSALINKLGSEGADMAAKALRSHQGTATDANAVAIARSVAEFGAPVIAPAVAKAVVALNDKGVPADISNEVVASALDAYGIASVIQ
jgi:hypothetical protein